MDTPDFKKLWEKQYKIVPEKFERLTKIKAVATGFNANIDAVCHLSGEKLGALIKKTNLTLAELEDIKRTRIVDETDLIKGIFKTFRLGIAEEWICENEAVYEWIKANIGYENLQIGGQGGIIANVLSSVGIQKVYAHTNSLPKIQAAQFLRSDSLLSFDENGAEKPIWQIDRKKDTPLIHFIIEFGRGDIVEVDGKQFKCPRANRFIATYDPLNLKLVMDNNFISAMKRKELDFVILSGFHALLEKNDGVALIKKAATKIKEWKQAAPDAIFHLEVASTQDLVIRKAITDHLICLVDSVGINERETIDLLEVIDQKGLAKRCREQTTAENLLKGLSKIKEETGIKRLQLHMFGLYMTLQDHDYRLSPEDNLQGMLTASVVAAAKAKTGGTDLKDINAVSYDVSDVGLIEIESLSSALGQPNLALTGIGRYRQWDLIVVPTILIEKPKTLVGMGDTISSLSLVSAKR